MKKNYHWILLGIAFGIIIYLGDKSGVKLTVIDTDKETGITKLIEGEWVKIGVEFDQIPSDDFFDSKIYEYDDLVYGMFLTSLLKKKNI